MIDVFISYSSKDQKIADAIINYLESDKIKCWIAYRDVEAGSDYAASIVNAIKSTTIFLLVFSENSNTSKHILREIDTACKYKKTIIPFKISDVKLDDAMEYYLNTTHWLDAISKPLENHLKNLVSIINKYLDRSSTILKQELVFNKPNTGNESKILLISGSDVSEKDIKEALDLDHIVYDIDESVQFTIEKCLTWHSINPDIYFMLKDTTKDEVVGYVNLAPITEDCFERILLGKIWDIEITENYVLPYEFPGVYYLNFTSIVVHPKYRNAGMIIQFVDAIANKIIELFDREIYFKAMIADAITPDGDKFCRLFGMNKVTETEHQSKIYHVSLLPPKFKKCSKSITKLFEMYEKLEVE
jgi:hypothetical protein